MQKGMTIDYILGYVPQRKAGAPRVRISKNQKYRIKMPVTPKGVHVIVSKLHKFQYSDHDILAYLEYRESTYEQRKHGKRVPLTREPAQCALGL